MQDIVKVVNFDKYGNKNKPIMDDERTKKVLNRLFTRFESIFPKFWVNIKSQEHLNGIKTEWFKCFQKANLFDTRLIEIGLDKARASLDEYLPKASKFIEWCTEDESKSCVLPDAYEAFKLCGLINQKFSDYIHPDIRIDTILHRVIREIGAIRLREMNEKSAFKLFENVYCMVCRQFIEGKIEKVQRALPEKSEFHPEDRERSNAARKKCMEMLREKGIAIQRRL